MQTQDAILNYAEKACRSRGFDAFSFADAADHVGIRKASVHHHFPTKADLAVSMIDRYCAQLDASICEIEERRPRAAAQLRDWVKLYRTALGAGDSLCLCVAMSAHRESLPREAIERVNAFNRMSIDFLARLFERGKKDRSIRNVGWPKDEAASALALVEGAQLIARAARRPALFDNALRTLIQRAV